MSEPLKDKQPTHYHPDDFYQQVLTSFKDKDYTEEEIEQKQAAWQRFEEPMKKSVVNDFPTYFYAGFWIRFWAFLIDMLCITAITKILLDVGFRALNLSMSPELFSVYGLLSISIYLAYFTLLTKLNRGQTIGKMIFGIRVIGLNEEELSWQTVLVREVACRFALQANPFLYVGYLPTAFTKRKQHAGDYLTDTSVVTLNMIKAFNKQVQV
ncbi:RDD family protein [Enterococcus saccharolyticus]|uniref:RDD domain-containing protein n=1 Tax=Enterococcus saccharolyticus subsp. saccharolyticus ATCC 43076 TaxID=1139996 RepID=S0JMT3_9ENTE|nr:RDD family protein [Enterococcus saccharolyticus]EOT29178.1 hypothetical protein OMQ_01130 [Enterococcus saccharolyticus subsp. saccharolyticus ATCC 43076]EOT80977.1 hypothetical protein I572_01509 [Enterococcus saccharolyticus subsp. saccharolyticus ATCC 43076]OJG89566.1 hypothetical protein RV16_GL002108 [Enterococcus saccharolyticus]